MPGGPQYLGKLMGGAERRGNRGAGAVCSGSWGLRGEAPPLPQSPGVGHGVLGEPC